MQRTYSYLSSKYKVHVVFLGYFMVVIAVFCAIKLIIKPELNIYVLAFVAAAYGAANTFIFKSNPKDIIIDDDTISFVSPFGEVKYDIKRLVNFQVKDFANAQFYIRAAQDDGKKSRFWIAYYYFNDRNDLMREFYYIQKKVDPKNIIYKGREKMFMYRPGTAPEGWDENAGDDE